MQLNLYLITVYYSKTDNIKKWELPVMWDNMTQFTKELAQFM